MVLKAALRKQGGFTVLWTLEHGLGKDWTPEVTEAWTKCYTTLADAMINAS